MQKISNTPGLRRVLGVVVVLAVLAGLWQFLGRKSEPQINYETATVDRGVVEKTVSSSGSVAALITVDVGSQISGQISELKVDFNSPVRKGDLLAVIDPQTYKSRVVSAEADVAVARANVGTQEATIRKAISTLEQADSDYKRQQALAEQKLVSVSAVEIALKTLQLAKGDLDIGQAQLANVTATLRTRQAALDQARIDLSRTEIRSPIDGVVIKRAIDLGQTVAASLQAPVLFSIAQDLSRIQIEAKVDEADIGSIKPEDVATFTVDAFPDQNFQGRVAQVRLAATTVQNVVTYSVMVQAANPRQMLLPGMTANVRIVTDRRENVLRVANDAARFQPAGASANRGPAGVPGAGVPDAAGGAGAGGFAAQNAATAEELGLTKEQQDKLEKGRRELFAQLRSQSQGSGIAAGGGLPGGGQGGGNFGNFGDQQAQVMRVRMENLMRSVLTPEQLLKWQAQRNARGGVRVHAGTLYTLSGKTPKAHAVRLGLADDKYTELVGGDLKDGDSVILRSRMELKK
jgi:HlyD family secretion protein